MAGIAWGAQQLRVRLHPRSLDCRRTTFRLARHQGTPSLRVLRAEKPDKHDKHLAARPSRYLKERLLIYRSLPSLIIEKLNLPLCRYPVSRHYAYAVLHHSTGTPQALLQGLVKSHSRKLHLIAHNSPDISPSSRRYRLGFSTVAFDFGHLHHGRRRHGSGSPCATPGPGNIGPRGEPQGGL
jgi:hypothetical protein